MVSLSTLCGSFRKHAIDHPDTGALISVDYWTVIGNRCARRGIWCILQRSLLSSEKAVVVDFFKDLQFSTDSGI